MFGELTEEDIAQIVEIFDYKYAEAVRNRDEFAYLELYTDDAIWMPPNDIDRVGKDEISCGFQNMISDKNIDPTFIHEEIKGSDELAYVLGTSDATLFPLDGSPTKKAKFRALWIMKKEDYQWKIYRQIWNNKPI